MRKQTKLYLLIINFLVILFLFSQKLYAQSLHFVAYGDTRRDMKTKEKPQVRHNAMAKVIREMNPDFILFTGDMVYSDEFERFLEVITNNYVSDKMIPLYPVIGNHELVFTEKVDTLIQEFLKKTGGLNKPGNPDAKIKIRSRQVLCEEFMDKLNPAYVSYLKEVLMKTNNGQSWYSFIKEVNGLKIKFIALNSSLPDDEEQFQWFLNEIRQFRGPKIIFEHYPPYSIGFHGCTDLRDKKSMASGFRDRYTKFFNDVSNDIVFVISGHDHNYQRICKTDKTGGIQLPVYIVSGGGGAELTGQGECDVSQIPLDGFQCLGLITAYQFVDVAAYTDNKKDLLLKCKVLGLRCDLKKGLPDDGTFERQFVNDRLELIDDFTLNWQRQNTDMP